MAITPGYLMQTLHSSGKTVYEAVKASYETKVKVDLEKCDGDAVCVDTCPVEVFEIKDGKSIVINNDECIVCRACEVQCPKSAIEIIE